uniref:Uncharacterized protein n=1 Tax=Arundo donax TaxID=35708 RepID=A0A0A8ZG21_ARUDO
MLCLVVSGDDLNLQYCDCCGKFQWQGKPLRVGLLSGSLLRSDLFYRVYISGRDVNFLLSLCIVYLSIAIIL